MRKGSNFRLRIIVASGDGSQRTVSNRLAAVQTDGDRTFEADRRSECWRGKFS
jgi:hypothetical protein